MAPRNARTLAHDTGAGGDTSKKREKLQCTLEKMAISWDTEVPSMFRESQLILRCTNLYFSEYAFISMYKGNLTENCHFPNLRQEESIFLTMCVRSSQSSTESVPFSFVESQSITERLASILPDCTLTYIQL